MIRTTVAALVAVLALTGAAPAAADTVRAAIGNTSCHVSGPDARIRYVGDELVFIRDRKVVAGIGADYTLKVDGQPVELTPAQQFDVAMYRESYDQLIAEAKELGREGAKLGINAAASVLGALFSGGLDEVEERIEAEAAVIEARAALLCNLAETLEAQHRTLATGVPEFGRAVPL